MKPPYSIWCCSLVWLSVLGCEAASDSVTPQADTAGTVDVGTDNAADSGGLPDVAADTTTSCSPACDPWQSCLDGACSAKSCVAHEECRGPEEASNPVHFCYKGTCAAYQCATDVDCAANEVCNKALYLCQAAATGCISNAECDDNNSCTQDYCDEFGECSNEAKFGCCAADTDCNDGSACTTDSCAAGKCAYTSLSGCCQTDGDCSDGNPCTTDSCSGGTCQYASISSCCKADIQCDDNADWTTDLCKQNKCIYQVSGATTTCASNGDCSANGCIAASCVGGQCSYSSKAGSGCCTQDSQCATDTACTVQTCGALQCSSKAVVGTGGYVWHRFDDANKSPWTFTGSSQSVKFHLSTLSKVGGASALRYGVPAKVTFEDSTPNKGDATSPAFVVPAAASVSFWLLLDASPGAAIHLAGLDVLAADGKVLEAGIWSKAVDLNTGTTSGKWLQFTKSLQKFAGQNVKLRFWFDHAKYDTSNKNKLGLMVDELVVSGACP